MGWANCGKDSRGRRMGYAISAKCDKKGCKTRIDRGLDYCCGGMHEGEEVPLPTGEFFKTCGGYFCPEHRGFAGGKSMCEACAAEYETYDPDDEYADSISPYSKNCYCPASERALKHG